MLCEDVRKTEKAGIIHNKKMVRQEAGGLCLESTALQGAEASVSSILHQHCEMRKETKYKLKSYTHHKNCAQKKKKTYQM